MSTKKLTTEEFIEKARRIHGDKYDYSKVEYINSKTPVCIICPEHGEFWQKPNNHLNGSNCPKCAKKIFKMPNRVYKHTTETFIEKAKKIHGDKYDYSKVKYVDTKTKVCIICSEHGEFWQYPSNHLKGCGCSFCSNNKNYSTLQYIEKLKKIKHDNILFDKVSYINNMTPITFICKLHGEFERIPSTIKDEIQCPECIKLKLHDKYAKTTEEFIKESKKIHNNFYSYDKTSYKTASEKVIITCPIHGDFEQAANNHLQGGGCPKCSYIKGWNKRKDKLTTELFIEKAKQVHGNKYDYSKVVLPNYHSKVCIICKQKDSKNHFHGEFWQNVGSHLQGAECPKCSITNHSKKEDEIAFFIDLLNIDYMSNVRNIINKNELDIYIPEKQVAIEFDGLYWHNEIKCKFNPIHYHLDKTNLCKEKGIRLIHIFEDEWLYKEDIVKSRLKSILGIKERTIRAHKCELKEVDNKTAKEFLENNHLQGNVNSKYRYGLYYNNELVSLMTFSNLRKNLNSKAEEGSFELLRFVNKLNTTVYGAASKLLKHFINEIKPKRIISYADKRWSDGNLYKKLGFTHTHDSKPNYFYIINNKRENRFKYRKSELVKQGFDSTKSEHEIMLERGIYRIYDCGTMVFEMKLNF